MTGRVEWANSLRGVAALSVVVCHLGISFWIMQEAEALIGRRPPLYVGDSGIPRTAELLYSVPIELGAFGVGIFFVLSGFVVSISLDRYNRRAFVVGRLMRVLPTYAAGYLVLCGVAAASGDPLDELHVGNVLAGMVPGLFLVLGVSVPNDGVSWTLVVEFVFYGLCLLGHRTLTHRWWAIAAAALSCVLVQWLVAPPTVIAGSSSGGLRYIVLLAAPFLPVMLIGLTLSGRSRGHLTAPTTALLLVGLTGVHLYLMTTSAVVPSNLTYKMTFLGVIALVSLIWKVGGGWRKVAVAGFAADISYPLYVVHAPLGFALLAVLVSHGVRPVLAIPLVLAVVVGAAWVLHRLVEMPTHRLGQRWSRRLSPAPQPVGAPLAPVAARPVHEAAAVLPRRVSVPVAPPTQPMAAVGNRADLL